MKDDYINLQNKYDELKKEYELFKKNNTIQKAKHTDIYTLYKQINDKNSEIETLRYQIENNHNIKDLNK